MRYANLIRSIRNWPSYFVFKYNLTKAPVARFALRSGDTILVPREVLHEFKEVFFDEAYAAGLPLDVPAGSTLIDIGANIGAFSVFALSRFPGARVVAFEPDPVNFSHLEANAALAAGRLVPVKAAVAGTAGTLTFRREAGDKVSTSGSLKRQEGIEYQVAATTLADAFSQYGIESCGLLKMDCEGAEYDIIYGAGDEVLARIRQMVIEVHDKAGPGENRAALAEHLAGRGFQVKNGLHSLLWAWR